MPIEAIWRKDNGLDSLPKLEEDWLQWVSAGRTRNWCEDDPILDWLDLYGEGKGYIPDTKLDGYLASCDFREHIFRKGKDFEVAVIRCLQNLVSIETVASGREDARDIERAKQTFDLMASGANAIYQPVLWDAENQTYGMPDLLIRSDVINSLFSVPSLRDEVTSKAAPDLQNDWHYVVVDIKFKSIELSARQREPGSDALGNKVQLAIYNRALGRLQGYTPSQAFILARAVNEYKSRDTRSCLHRLAPVTTAPVLDVADAACAWIRKLRGEGATWSLNPPSTLELRPNMSNTSDGPWHHAKKLIAEQQGELSLLWQVTPANRDGAYERGIKSWLDPACKATYFGLSEKREHVLQSILDVNQLKDGPIVMPSHVVTERAAWGEVPELEFYVDFETVSDLNDDFSKMPDKGGQPLIFMIGCGHIHDGEWKFECFIADSMSEPAERQVIEEWLQHMRNLSESKGVPEPTVYHWSHAERSFLDTAYNSAKARHNSQWPDLNWFDFLVRVMREEPVVTRGATAFGLKAVAKAMHRARLIETNWKEGPLDGLAAMVGAWWCGDQAEQKKVSLRDIPLMKEIQDYNEIDCKVMMEIIAYLRLNH